MSRSKKISFRALKSLCAYKYGSRARPRDTCDILMFGTDTKFSDSESAIKVCECCAKNCPVWNHTDGRVVSADRISV